MTKTELVAIIADKVELTKKDAEAALNAFMDSVKEALAKGDKVTLVYCIFHYIADLHTVPVIFPPMLLQPHRMMGVRFHF